MGFPVSEIGTSSFELVEIGVGRGMAQGAAHGDDLAFVMEGVSQDVMKNKRWSSDGRLPVREMQFCICIELLVCQA